TVHPSCCSRRRAARPGSSARGRSSPSRTATRTRSPRPSAVTTSIRAGTSTSERTRRSKCATAVARSPDVRGSRRATSALAGTSSSSMCTPPTATTRRRRRARSRSSSSNRSEATPGSLTPVSPEQLKGRSVPLPGEAPMPATDAAELLRRNASDPELRDRPAIKFDDRVWTHGEYVAECHRWANYFLAHTPPDRALHVGVLLDNTPDYLFALGGAALSGSAVVGINHTRRDEHLLRDIGHTHCGLVVTEPRHTPLLDPIADQLPDVLVSNRFPGRDDPDTKLGTDLDDALASVDDRDAGVEPGPD